MREVRAVLAWLLVNGKREGKPSTLEKARTPTVGWEERKRERRNGKGAWASFCAFHKHSSLTI